ncbi:hypothetical protein ABH995_000739 [Bradyrhizobium yuanmingense]
MLTNRWRLNADIAYLPWTDFKGATIISCEMRPPFLNNTAMVAAESKLKAFCRTLSPRISV